MSTLAGFACFFCGALVSDEYLCSGCGKFVCDDCDHDAPWGPHEPEEHQDNDEYDEEEG